MLKNNPDNCIEMFLKSYLYIWSSCLSIILIFSLFGCKAMNDKNQKNLINFLSGLEFIIEGNDSLLNIHEILDQSNEFGILVIHLPLLSEKKINLIQKIKSNQINIGIILMSSKQNSGLAISLLKKGTIDHFVSPDDHAGIYSAIKNEYLKK